MNKYYVPPPFILSYRKYQNVNADKNLQHMVTKHFYEIMKKKIKTKKFKKDGYDMVYILLRLFIKKAQTNWYDLELQEQLVIDYIMYKLTN